MAAKRKAKKKTNWVKTAVKHPGAFRAWCKRQGYSGVNTRCIQKGKKSKNLTIKRRAILAENFRKMAKKRKKSKKK